MSREITKASKAFADEYMETGNGVQSALKGYKLTNYNSAKVLASRMITHDNVKKYIASKAQDASSMIYKLSQKGKAEVIRLNASRDILDRAGFKPVERTDITSMGEKIPTPIYGGYIESKNVEEINDVKTLKEDDSTNSGKKSI